MNLFFEQKLCSLASCNFVEILSIFCQPILDCLHFPCLSLWWCLSVTLLRPPNRPKKTSYLRPLVSPLIRSNGCPKSKSAVICRRETWSNFATCKWWIKFYLGVWLQMLYLLFSIFTLQVFHHCCLGYANALLLRLQWFHCQHQSQSVVIFTANSTTWCDWSKKLEIRKTTNTSFWEVCSLEIST